MTDLSSLTVAELQRLRPLRPDLANFADRLLVYSYQNFIEVLYRDLDNCIRYIEEDPKVRKGDGEDRLTAELIGQLRSQGYDASHDELIGGHSDIVVRHQIDKYIWVAEAKIHRSYEYLIEGFNQLNTRYLQGTLDRNEGALLIYISNVNVASVVKNWSSTLENYGLADFDLQPCKTRGQLGFYNTHKHEGSGMPVRIRHVGIKLTWNPK